MRIKYHTLFHASIHRLLFLSDRVALWESGKFKSSSAFTALFFVYDGGASRVRYIKVLFLKRLNCATQYRNAI